MISLNNLFKRKQKLFDFEQPGGTLDWTPLHVASYTGSFEVIQELIKKAKVDVFARAANLKTPRMVARNSLAAKVFRTALADLRLGSTPDDVANWDSFTHLNLVLALAQAL